MRILVVGAGAVGGYFGARLAEAGVDTTFLVRARRQAQLRHGLSVRSPLGDIQVAAPATVTAETVRPGYEAILLSCKAYDLGGAIDAFAPAVDARTAVLPLLNGMGHLDVLKERFGAERVLGGLCQIASTLDEEGRVLHLHPMHQLTFGELSGARTPRVEAIDAAFRKTRFDARLSEAILQEMWEKWVFIATLAGSTCLMRASVGEIIRSGSGGLPKRMLAECAAIAQARGFAPRPQALARMEAVVSEAASGLTASMLRDLERGSRTEADHILGDLLARRGPAAAEWPLLDVAYAHLKTYELRRENPAAKPERLVDG